MQNDDTENFGLVPNHVYRKTDPNTRKILGLSATQIDEAINNGTLPPPFDVLPGGHAKGWMGLTLIQLLRERLARAEAKQRERQATKGKS